jgi:hypothetical protein
MRNELKGIYRTFFIVSIIVILNVSCTGFRPKLIYFEPDPSNYGDKIKILNDERADPAGLIYWANLEYSLWLNPECLVYPVHCGTHTPYYNDWLMIENLSEHKKDSLEIEGIPNETCFGIFKKDSLYVGAFKDHVLTLYILRTTGLEKYYEIRIEIPFDIEWLTLSPNGRKVICSAWVWIKDIPPFIKTLIIDTENNTVDSLDFDSSDMIRRAVFESDSSFFISSYQKGMLYYGGDSAPVLIDSNGGSPIGFWGNRYLVTEDIGAIEGELYYYDKAEGFRKTKIDIGLLAGGADYDSTRQEIIYSKFTDMNVNYSKIMCYSLARSNLRTVFRTNKTIFNPRYLK